MNHTITLTKDQQAAVDFAVERIINREPLTTIGGYAGTGKSTITGFIVNAVRERMPNARFAFACYTGKAKSVLESKLRAAGAIGPDDFCGTLHSLLYRPITSYQHDEEENTIEKIVRFDSRDESDREMACVFVDEASMVDERIYDELCRFGSPILAIGDHGQLPPVSSRFNLMETPMIRLEKIHRQAEGNPIIRASIMAREDGDIPLGEIGPGVMKTRDGSAVNGIPDILDWTLICGTNRKRCRLNGWMRHRLFGSNNPSPIVGDRVICLQNNHKRGIFNGMTGIIKSYEVIDRHWFIARIDMGEFDYYGKIFRYQFGNERTLNKTVAEAPEVHPDDFEDLFDYGYVLTAHKSQGSEFANVVVYEEDIMRRAMGANNWKRWLYTAVTRAKEKLIIVGGI